MVNKTWKIFCILVAFGIIALASGINMFASKTQDYDSPIYISQKLTMNESTNYTITGVLTNLTNKEIYIEELTIRLFGGKKGKVTPTFYGDVTTKNIIIAPYENYHLSSPIPSNFKDLNSGATIVKCIIDNENYMIKESKDGITYNENDGGAFILSFLGVAMLVTSIVLGLSSLVRNKHKNKE